MREQDKIKDEISKKWSNRENTFDLERKLVVHVVASAILNPSKHLNFIHL
jgi:hypothetical protein